MEEAEGDAEEQKTEMMFKEGMEENEEKTLNEIQS